MDEASETEIKNNLLLILKSEAGYFLTEDFDFSTGGGFNNSLKGSIKENYTLRETTITGADIVGKDRNLQGDLYTRRKDKQGLHRQEPKKRKYDEDEIDIEKKLEALKKLFLSRLCNHKSFS